MAIGMLILAAALAFAGTTLNAEVFHSPRQILDFPEIQRGHFHPLVDATTPARSVPIKVQIKKTEFKSGADGSLEVVTTPVCAAEAMINIYDARGGAINIPESEWERVTCSSELGGQPTQVRIFGVVGLLRRSVFDDEEAADLRVSPIGLEVDDEPQLGVSETLISRDLEVASTVTHLRPQVTVLCESRDNGESTCEVTPNELFSATVEIKN